MRFKSRTWLLISLFFFTASYLVWTYAEKVSAARREAAAAASAQKPPTAKPAAPLTKAAVPPAPAKPKSYRLSNTRATEKQLMLSDHAILLRNALIDTDRPLKLNIPDHLKAKGAPGSYIVQSDRALDQRFRDRLAADGVKYVSYIPNNAALVEATPEQAKQMASDIEFQAVIPYEPYYKLASSLLPSAVNQDQNTSLAINVTAVPGQTEAAVAALKNLGGQIMGEDKGPFGTTISAMMPAQTLVAVAQMPLAQEIEPYAPRRLLNDLTRVTMGISSNTAYTSPNYLNLSGSNVTVNMNDTGVDSTHPDLMGRVFGMTNDNASGHGTHVAGVIMGSGKESSTVTVVVPGETSTGVGFQGKATNAMLFVQKLPLAVSTTLDDAFRDGGSFFDDATLARNASANLGATNLISNNSWGYENINYYDMHAASFDQYTRDAQPGLPGEQPLLFVFAAGGQGSGNTDGTGGSPGSILSPGTAKNVITVGAMDSARFITNQVAVDDTTNDVFYSWTDADNLIAWFSGCGNVGEGIEGMYGRFKPDVVAPGMFIISCRASTYIDPTNETYVSSYYFPNQFNLSDTADYFTIPQLPTDTEELIISVTSNANSTAAITNLAILGNTYDPPTTIIGTNNYLVLTTNLTDGQQWYFGITNAYKDPIAFDVTFYIVETNTLGEPPSNPLEYFNVISNMNHQTLGSNYVYQYGTSQAAGAVSGVLALMQDFLENRMKLTNYSPALLKAMLINGSRSIEQQYDFNPNVLGANEQGWGMPNITTCVPATLTNASAQSMVLIDQSASNSLATGQSISYTVNAGDPNATNFPVRFSLVWTDPPGDPAAGIALVNNLDLIVTDKSGTNIWLGNDFYSGDIYTEVNTGDVPDIINNVQNIYLDPASTNSQIQFPLTVTVLGMRVNVNAPTTVSNLIAQDFALVISTDDPVGALTVTSNPPTFTPPANLFSLIGRTNAAGGSLLSSNGLANLFAFAQSNSILVTVANSGVPLLHQRVGAYEPNLYTNGPLYTNTSITATYAPTGTNGNVVQWHFFVFTNNVTNYMSNGISYYTNNAQYVAFTTFDPPDLATEISPRTNGADLDMYVSTNPGLTNLDPAVFAEMTTNDLSVGRGGTETVLYSNSYYGEVYYVGIKSEDQQAADFGFYAVAQALPFSSVNPDGSVTAVGSPLPTPINANLIGPPALVFAFLFDPQNPQLRLRNLTAELGISAGNPSDFYGTLQHDNIQSVLNNFSGQTNGFTNFYNDLSDGTSPPGGGRYVTADGPGSLRNYITTGGSGVWILSETDSTLFQEGEITQFSVTGYPQPPFLGSFQITIAGNTWFDDYVLVPNDATNMIISASYVAGDGPIGIFITNQDDVNFGDYGSGPVVPPGGYFEYGITNVPPLDGGYWFYGIYNSNTASVTLNISISFQLNLVPNLVQNFTNNAAVPLPTDATTNLSTFCLTNVAGDQIVDLSVGLRLADPNLDNLAISLTSPQGTSIVLFENRGGILASNLGLSLTNGPSNYVYTVFTEDTNLATTPIKFGQPPYAYPVVVPQLSLISNTFDVFTNLEDFYTNQTTRVVTSNAAGIYTNGQNVAGWFVETNMLVVVSGFSNFVTGTGTNITTNYVPQLYTNQYFNEVSIVTDPSVTYDGTNIVGTNAPGANYIGSNYLALASGRLSQTFITVPGVAYELIYYVRPPGLQDWWPGDDNLIDLVGTNTGTVPEKDVSFGDGEVYRAFTFSGTTTNALRYLGNEVDFGTNVANFRTNDFTVDFWIQQSPTQTNEQACMEKRTECNATISYWNIEIGGGAVAGTNVPPGCLRSYIPGNNNTDVANIVCSNAINDGIFHHAALMRHGTNVTYYIDGRVDATAVTTGVADINNTNTFRIGQSVCVSPGILGSDACQPFNGKIDELGIWNRALSPAEIQAIFNAGASGKYSTNTLYPNFQVVFDGISTNDVVLTNFSSPAWLRVTNSFTAVSNQTTIELLGNTLGVLLDGIELIQPIYTNYNNYFLPEEPLAPLIGQDPSGCWTLSIWDTRTDTILPTNGTLLSWDLQVTTSSTNVHLIVLTNGIAYTNGSVSGDGGFTYFGIDVPRTANFATNMLFNSSGPMNLWFNQTALPTGSAQGDYLLTNNAPGASNAVTLSTIGAPPPLVPGSRYYLGVQNAGGGTETFNIEVQFDVSGTSGITSLNPVNGNGTNSIDPIISGNAMQYYSLTIPTNVSLATFQLLNPTPYSGTNTNAQVNLYVREGYVPTTNIFDYASANQGAVDQFVAITTNSTPVALPSVNPTNVEPQYPTTWYVAVYNPLTNSVNYTILASYVTNGSSQLGTLDTINLNNYFTNSGYTYYVTNAYNNSQGAASGFPTSLIYALTIPKTTLGEVEFVVTNLSGYGNLQLLVGYNEIPTPENAYGASYNLGVSNQSVIIFTNEDLPTLQGTWYVAVPNTSPSLLKYSITAIVTNDFNQVLIWDGLGGPNWNFTEKDWRIGTNTTDTTYGDTDTVLFDDTLKGSSTITVATTVQPGSMTFSNSAVTYTFAGPNPIAGPSGMLIGGGGEVILDNASNTFAGQINISNGTLQIGNNDANGSIAANVSISAGSSLDFDRVDDLTYGGVLSGGGTVDKEGADVLTLAGDNVALGGTVFVQAGILRVGAINALGIGANASIIIGSQGTLDLNGFSGDYSVITQPSRSITNGSIINDGGAAAIPGLGSITMLANATFGGTANWDLGNPDADSTNGFSLSTEGAAENLTKVGPNAVGIYNTSVDPALANIDVQSGALVYGGRTSGLGNPANTLTVESGAALAFDAPVNPLNKSIVFQDGSVDENEAGSSVITGPVYLGTNVSGAPGTINFDIAGALQAISNTISGPGSLVLNGGSLYLYFPNTFTGATILNSGTLYLTALGGVPDSLVVTIGADAILDLSGRANDTFRVTSGQMLDGFGFLSGILIEASGSTVMPGSSNVVGTLVTSSNITLNGTTLLKIQNATGQNDQLRTIQGSITYGGTLQVTNISTNAFYNGESFQLFNAAAYAGAFARILPPAPGPGLNWNTNALVTSGVLSIGGDSPVFTSVTLSGNTLTFSGTNGVPNGPYTIYETTNLALPLSSWTPIATKNFNASGGFLFTEPYSKSVPAEFFTIQQQP